MLCTCMTSPRCWAALWDASFGIAPALCFANRTVTCSVPCCAGLLFSACSVKRIDDLVGIPSTWQPRQHRRIGQHQKYLHTRISEAVAPKIQGLDGAVEHEEVCDCLRPVIRSHIAPPHLQCLHLQPTSHQLTVSKGIRVLLNMRRSATSFAPSSIPTLHGAIFRVPTCSHPLSA